MNFHPGVKPALWGAVAGAAAISVIGFSSMGWMLGGTAERMAVDRAESAVVSVLTALARLELDPWDEAARLAHLTREAAADQLARMIARLSDRCWNEGEARRISDGLINRLPMAGAAAKSDRPAPGTRLNIGLG